MLRTLVLATGDDAGRNVRDAHGGVRGVNVLAAFTAGAVSVDADIIRLDIDLDGIVDLRRDKHAGKRSVAALGLIEGRNAHETMHADFARSHSESVASCHSECG